MIAEALRSRRVSFVALAIALVSSRAQAQSIAAEPAQPIEAPFPQGAPPIEVQIVLQLIIDEKGNVESAVETSRAPVTAPDSFATAALGAVRAAKFTPSTRDGRPVRSRIEHVVVFHPAPDSASVPAGAAGAPAPSAPPPPAKPISTNEQDEDYAQVVDVRGQGWSSPRGIGDVRVKRELLDASPRLQTSEMLSAAPGFFVDHEDGEGLGNDVYLRGFDLDHGSGIEMRLGSIPINIPNHIQGQGYADVNFIIPEVVRSVRVLEGPYDPRQGDAAIVGSAYFDLGVAERGYQVKGTYGSFNQMRLVGIAAPKELGDETFVAFSLRKTNGFGENRAAESGSVNAQYGFDLGVRDHLKLLATAYGSRASLAGVVRQDQVDAGQIGYYDSYPTGAGFFAGGQGVQASRVVLGADFDHVSPSGGHFELAPWFMWTDFLARQNFTGDLQSSQINPALSGLGDLFETTNLETAGGVTSRYHTAAAQIGSVAEVSMEPGVYIRVGHTEQTKSLLEPTNLQAWDRRINYGLDTLDAGAYLDLDIRVLKHLRVSGGPRADLLMMSIDNRLANVVPNPTTPAGALPGAMVEAEGIAAGPRITAEYEISPAISPVVSYGEGFRSLDAQNLQDGSSPYSKVRSVEAGIRAQAFHERYTATLAAFDTWVANELVFEAPAGGMETEAASTRRGFVASLVARPCSWLLASSALSVTDAEFTTLAPGISHYVPNVPPIVFRTDVTARGALGKVRGTPMTGRLGVGYTFLSARHLTDTIMGPTTNALNAAGGLRGGFIAVGVDAYNVLDLKYADDAEVYVSNWSLKPGQQPASLATHITAAPPLTVLGTVSLYF